MAIDFSARASFLLSQCPDILFKWFPIGKVNGFEFQIGNLRGDPGKSLSINMKTGVWKDFGERDVAGSDLTSLFAAKNNLKMSEAAIELGATHTNGHATLPPPVPVVEPPPLLIAPDDALIPTHRKHGAPSAHWFYRNAEGQIIGIVCRFDLEMGKKEVIPAIWNKTGWKWAGFPKPRPLYGLQGLAQRPDAPVCIVEGEKAASAAARLLPSHVAITWPGGALAVKHADWAPLKGRHVTIVPDIDNPGRKAAAEIAEILGHGYVVRTTGTTGYDLADAEADGWTEARTLEFIAEQPPEPEHQQPGYEPRDIEQNFFRVLGYDGDEFYFYSHLAERVVEISRGSMGSPAALLQIAPMRWWQATGMSNERGNIQTTAAADMLINECYARGLYNPADCRGRGAWDDDGNSVLHVGNKLIVNGEPTALREYKSRYLYEKRQSMGVDYHDPIKTASAHKLLGICKLIRWEEKISAELLAGWIVIAPICGALTHRPHIYLIGPATSGKSWVVEEVISGVLGKTAFVTASKSTAAGIRQSLRSDALPVIFDEAEAEELHDRMRLQEVFDMARVSFNGDAAPIHKGTADQTGKSYMPRSCFAFASINMSMKRYADETRTTILKISPPSKNIAAETEKFSVLQKLATETITPEWRGGLLARTVNLIPTIKTNAKIFAQEAALYFGSRRQGDQLGAVLAGLYSLHSTGIVTAQAARDFIHSREWPQQKELIDDSSHTRLWKFMQEIELKVDTVKGVKTRTVSEMIATCGGKYDEEISKAAADSELRRKGFRVEDGFVWVSNTNSWIDNRLKATEWPGKWAHTLKCVAGAMVSAKSRRFTTVDRCIGIPVEVETDAQYELGE